jgi:hypothetical protein
MSDSFPPLTTLMGPGCALLGSGAACRTKEVPLGITWANANGEIRASSSSVIFSPPARS